MQLAAALPVETVRRSAMPKIEQEILEQFFLELEKT